MVDKANWLPVIEEERSRHPRMGPQDLQKLIYQATFGGDHLFGDAARFAQTIEDEWDRLASGEDLRAEQPLQMIDPRGRTARIHLAVCKARDVPSDELAERLVTQPLRRGTRSSYESHWGDVLQLAGQGRIAFDPEELAALPFPHHLPHHGPDYGPASYRIVHDVHDVETRRWLAMWDLLT